MTWPVDEDEEEKERKGGGEGSEGGGRGEEGEEEEIRLSGWQVVAVTAARRPYSTSKYSNKPQRLHSPEHETWACSEVFLPRLILIINASVFDGIHFERPTQLNPSKHPCMQRGQHLAAAPGATGVGVSSLATHPGSKNRGHKRDRFGIVRTSTRRWSLLRKGS